MDSKSLRDLLREARGHRSIEKMATAVSVAPNTWGGYERGERLPDIAFLQKVHLETGYSLEALLNGLISAALGDQVGIEVRQEHAQPVLDHIRRLGLPVEEDHAFVKVPRFDIQASAGPGTFADREAVVDFMAFRADWVRRDLRVDPAKLVLIRAVGDSMEPAIRAGDLLLIDTSVEQFVDDAIYVIVLDDALLVKRIQRFFGGAVAVRSDNPSYVEQTLAPEEAAGVHVAGRVRWIGRLI